MLMLYACGPHATGIDVRLEVEDPAALPTDKTAEFAVRAIRPDWSDRVTGHGSPGEVVGLDVSPGEWSVSASFQWTDPDLVESGDSGGYAATWFEGHSDVDVLEHQRVDVTLVMTAGVAWLD